MTNPETVESVLAEMRADCSCIVGGPNHGQCHNCALADRLADAHARDQRHYAEIERTWEWHKQTTIRAMTRAEVAEALLREALPSVGEAASGCPDTLPVRREWLHGLVKRISAHLSGGEGGGNG